MENKRQIKIAVLLACYNRKEKTLACLQRLCEQDLPDQVRLEVFLTDDDSQDGTAEAVTEHFPEVHIYHGTGSLFWAGGTRNSWQNALNADPDYYLLLNDDTFIVKQAIKNLLRHSEEYHRESAGWAIFVGTTKDPDSGKPSYGGKKLYSPWKAQSYLVEGNTENVQCDMANANIMLIPKQIVAKIGILSDEYTHFFADIDYALRANKAGFKVIVPPGIFGDCKNDHGKNWKSTDTSLAERLKYLYSPNGLAYNEYLYFIRRHFPFQLPAAIVKIWVKTMFPFVYDRFKR